MKCHWYSNQKDYTLHSTHLFPVDRVFTAINIIEWLKYQRTSEYKVRKLQMITNTRIFNIYPPIPFIKYAYGHKRMKKWSLAMKFLKYLIP